MQPFINRVFVASFCCCAAYKAEFGNMNEWTMYIYYTLKRSPKVYKIRFLCSNSSLTYERNEIKSPFTPASVKNPDSIHIQLLISSFENFLCFTVKSIVNVQELEGFTLRIHNGTDMWSVTFMFYHQNLCLSLIQPHLLWWDVHMYSMYKQIG